MKRQQISSDFREMSFNNFNSEYNDENDDDEWVETTLCANPNTLNQFELGSAIENRFDVSSSRRLNFILF